MPMIVNKVSSFIYNKRGFILYPVYQPNNHEITIVQHQIPQAEETMIFKRHSKICITRSFLSSRLSVERDADQFVSTSACSVYHAHYDQVLYGNPAVRAPLY